MQTASPIDLELDPIDWQQMELLAQLSPAQRTLTMVGAAEFVRAGLRATFHRHDTMPRERFVWSQRRPIFGLSF